MEYWDAGWNKFTNIDLQQNRAKNCENLSQVIISAAAILFFCQAALKQANKEKKYDYLGWLRLCNKESSWRAAVEQLQATRSKSGYLFVFSIWEKNKTGEKDCTTNSDK